MSSSKNAPKTKTPFSSLLQPPTFLTHDVLSEKSFGTSPASFRFSNIGEVSTAPTLYSDSIAGSRKSACSDEEIQAAPKTYIVSESASAEEKVGQWLSAGDDSTAQAVFRTALQQLATTVQPSDQTPTVVLTADNVLETAGLSAHDAYSPAASLVGVGQVVLQPPTESVEQTVPFKSTAVSQQASSEVLAPGLLSTNNGSLPVPVAGLLPLFLALTLGGIAACSLVNTCAFNKRCFCYHLQELVTSAAPPVLEVEGAACALVLAFRVYGLVLLLASVLAIIWLRVSLWILQRIAKAAGHDLHLVLPLMIAGKEVEAIVDDGGLNLMSIQDATNLGLEPSKLEMKLMTPYGDVFTSPGAVTADVGFPGEQHTKALTFRVVDVPMLPVTVNKAFRDTHGLQDPHHPHYRHRAYTAAELRGFFLTVASLVDPDVHNVRDFLQVDLPLACGDIEPVYALLDSGSAVDAVSLAFITKYLPKGKMRKCTKYVKCANGDRKHADQKMEVSFMVDGKPIIRVFYVFPHLKVDMILGGPFRVAHRPHTHMSNKIVSEELRIAGPYPAAAYHFSMEHAGAITSLLLRGWRHLKRQPTPPASAAMQLELDRARKAECELHGANSARISDIDDDNIRSGERAAERIRHLAVLGDTELLNDRLQAALALENGGPSVPAASSTLVVGQGSRGGLAVVPVPVIEPSTAPAIEPDTGPAAATEAPLPTIPAQPPVSMDITPPSPLVIAERTGASGIGTVSVSDVSDPRAGASERLHQTPEEPTAVQLTPATGQPAPASVDEPDEITAHPVAALGPAHPAESVAGSQSERSYPTNSILPASSDFAASTMSTPPPSHRSGSDMSPPAEQGVNSDNGKLTTPGTNGNVPTPEAGRAVTTPGDMARTWN